MELLIQAHLTRESFALTPALLKDYRHMLELAPRLLEELVKQSYGCLHQGCRIYGDAGSTQ